MGRPAMHASKTVTFDQLMIASTSLRVLTVLKSGQSAIVISLWPAKPLAA